MKCIIAGSRQIEDYEIVCNAIKISKFDITEVISGGARGVDRMGERYASENGLPVKIFKADWNKYGKSAGIKRNIRMGDYAEGLIAIWDGESRGTKHMIEYAKSQSKLIYIYICNHTERML